LVASWSFTCNLSDICTSKVVWTRYVGFTAPYAGQDGDEMNGLRDEQHETSAEEYAHNSPATTRFETHDWPSNGPWRGRSDAYIWRLGTIMSYLGSDWTSDSQRHDDMMEAFSAVITN
ncbi:hypothetical protein AC578_10903, partial [Pseudocercospora eumusae]